MTNLLNRLGKPKKPSPPTREQSRRNKSWKFNGTYKNKPLTRSMIKRVGSRKRAIELKLIKS